VHRATDITATHAAVKPRNLPPQSAYSSGLPGGLGLGALGGLTITVPAPASDFGNPGLVARYSVSLGITSKSPVLKPSSASGLEIVSGGAVAGLSVDTAEGVGGAVTCAFLNIEHPVNAQMHATAARAEVEFIIGAARARSWGSAKWSARRKLKRFPPPHARRNLAAGGIRRSPYEKIPTNMGRRKNF